MSSERGQGRLGRGVACGLLALMLAWLSLAVCGYRFGVADQVQYLSQYTAVRFPGTLDDDAYIQAFGALGSEVWTLIAWTTPEQALPGVLLTLMLLSVAGSALVLGSLGRRLLGGNAALLLTLTPALVLVTPKEQNYFGLVSLGDVEFTATVLVLTLVFASMTLFVRGCVVWSLLAAIAAAPIHGQTAAYLLAAWCSATIVMHRRDRRLVALTLGVGLMGVGGVLFLRSVNGVDPSHMDAYARLGHELYAPLIDIWSVPLKSWAALAFVLAFGALALPGYLRAASLAPRDVRTARERLLVYAAASLVFPLIGAALLGVGLEEPLLWRLMVSRSLMLIQIVSLVVAAVWCADRARQGGVGALYGALALVGLTLWPTPSLGHLAAGVVGIVTLGAIGMGSMTRQRPAPTRDRAGRLQTFVAFPAWMTAIVLGAVAFTTREYPWLSSPMAPAWGDAQAWARTSTPQGAVFITPPYLAGWRVGSHRPTFGELRDGGLLFYAGEPALEWEGRMERLGMTPRAWWFEIDPRDRGEPHEPLRRAYASDVAILAPELARTEKSQYLVVERGDAPWAGRAVYVNELFEVYELDGAGD
ncbi:MAG: DUF6798 domain-containing protein [Phycisphaerales bacterium]